MLKIASLILLIGWFFLSFRILEVPPGINGDEAVIGLNAALVARTGYDVNGRFLPLFTADKNSWDWKQPITFYSEVLAFRVFGPSFFTLRAVSVVFALVSGILILFLVQELLGLKTAIFGLIIFFLTPIVVIQSHLALENIAPVPFITLWLWMLIKYSKQKKDKYIIIAAISLGISFYSYLGLRLIAPTLALISLIYIYLTARSLSPQKINHRTVFLRKIRAALLSFTVSLLPFLFLLILVKNFYPAAILAQNRPSNLSSYQQVMLPYLSSFDLSFLFISGDSTPYHSTGKHGMFLLATLPLFALGIFKIAQKNSFTLNFILLTFFLTPIPLGITPSIHRASRLLFLLPFYIIVICLGLNFLIGIRKKLLRYLLLWGLFILIGLNVFDFVYDYWYEYPNRVKADFARPYHLVFKRAYQLSKENSSQVLIQQDFRNQYSVAIDFFEQVYFPNKLKLWKEDQPLPQNSILITSEHMVKILDGKKEIFGNYGFGLVVK